jgi:hypothetical protein
MTVLSGNKIALVMRYPKDRDLVNSPQRGNWRV